MGFSDRRLWCIPLPVTHLPITPLSIDAFLENSIPNARRLAKWGGEGRESVNTCNNGLFVVAMLGGRLSSTALLTTVGTSIAHHYHTSKEVSRTWMIASARVSQARGIRLAHGMARSKRRDKVTDIQCIFWSQHLFWKLSSSGTENPTVSSLNCLLFGLFLCQASFGSSCVCLLKLLAEPSSANLRFASLKVLVLRFFVS